MLFGGHYHILCLNYALCLSHLSNLYISTNTVEAACEQMLKAVTIFSAHFPHNLDYANSLNNLAFYYEFVNNKEAAEGQYVKAIAIYSTHFPQHSLYANCLLNYGEFLGNSGRKAEAITRVEAALQVSKCNNYQEMRSRCQSKLQQLRNPSNPIRIIVSI